MFHEKLRLIRPIIAFLIAAVVIQSCMWVAISAEADDITVYLDGRVINFPDAQPQMINNRVMVPLRAIGEEMGADVYWSSATGVAELILGNRFVRLTVNSPVMDYGYFVDYGVPSTELNENIYILSTPAIILDERILVPLRAISEGLGGAAEWVGETRTVVLTSAKVMSSVPPSVPTSVPDDNIFSDTPWFENISPTRAQSMYENDEKFVLVCYSGDGSSRMYIPLIKAAARESGVKTYGVDNRLPEATNLKFIKKYTVMDDIVYPVIFRVFGKGSVGVSIQPRHQENLMNLLSLFARNLMEDPDSPWGITTPTPIPKLDIKDTLEIRFNSIDLSAANRKLEDGERFIYVFYKSTAPNAENYLEIIKQAAVDAEVDIFATDASLYNYPESQRWWGNPDGRIVYPTVFFINNRVVTSIEEQPDNRNRLVQLFKAHN